VIVDVSPITATRVGTMRKRAWERLAPAPVLLSALPIRECHAIRVTECRFPEL